MNSDEEMVKKWMNILARKVLESKETVWEVENLVTIFYLLHPFSSTRNGAVLNLMNALTLKLTTSLAMSDPFTLEKCSRILFGLRDFSSQHKEVLSLVDLVQENLALGEVDESYSEMKMERESTVLSMAIHGLKSMNDDSPEVQRLLNYLAKRLRDHALGKNMVWKHWKGSQICSLLTGLRHKFSQSAEMEIIYEALPHLLPPSNSTRIWLQKHEYDNHHLVTILYEMRNMDYTHPGLQEVRSRVTSFLLNTSKAPSQWLSSQEMAMLAYIMQDLADVENCHQDLHLLLMFLERQLATLHGGAAAENANKTQHEYLSPQGFSMCVKGLHGIFENSPFKSNVYRILSIITEKVVSLDGQAIGNTLYSMRSMPAEHADVRSTLSRLSPLIEASMQSESGIMKTQEIANAFFGLQQMSSLYTEVLDIVRLLTLKLKQSRAVRNLPVLNFSAQEIANAISGLQTMSNSDKGSEIVREALGLLAEELEGCSEPMSPREIAYTCFGLQGFDSNCDEARAVLLALLPKLRALSDNPDPKTAAASNDESKNLFSLRDISYCLTGLSGMQRFTYSEIDDFVEELLLQITRTPLGAHVEVEFKQFGQGFRVTVGGKRVPNNDLALLGQKKQNRGGKATKDGKHLR
eukprot:scaffold539_cov187-Ochromonas_danica.AAC.10